MIIVLLSGGAGKRLWPLSNSIMSKQFLEILPTKDRKNESMIQRVYRQIKNHANYRVIVVAPKEQHELINLQLNNNVEIIEEPDRRGTYNAIKLVCAYLSKERIPNSEQICVIPIDIYVNDDFFNILDDIEYSINNSNKLITLVGIKPTYPSEKYGYIIPNDEKYIFKEKPIESQAKKYIEQGGLWNAGIFGFNLQLFDELDFDNLYKHYLEQENISFDYKICEHTDSFALIQYNGEWKDIGTWDTISDEIDDTYGNVAIDKCVGTTVINTLNKPLIATGLENIIVAATDDGILVSKKSDSQKIKDYVKELRPCFEQKRWGKYNIIDYGNGFLIKRLYINKYSSISYQSHKYRKEVWTIVQGQGIVTINDSSFSVKKGDTIIVEIGDKHKIYAKEDLIIIETQLGNILEEYDIERYDQFK